MKLPFKKEDKTRTKNSSPTAALAVTGVLLLCVSVSAFALLSEFPWNGNPINWLKAREFSDQGNRALQKFSFSEAQDRFKTAISIYPGDWRFYRGLALAQQLSDKKAAITSFQDALKLHKDVELYLELADTFIANKELKQAEGSAASAKSLEPLNSAASAELAIVLELEKKSEEAQKVFDSTGPMDKDSARFWFLSAKYHLLKGDLQRAEASLRQASSLEKTVPEYWEELGLLMLKKNDFQNAEIFLRRAARLNSSNAAYWSTLGDVCRRLNRIDKAEEAYKLAVQFDEKNSEYWLLWGLCMLVQERYEDAEKPLRHALEMDKTDSAKWNAYINCLQKQKKYKQAAQKLEEYLETSDNRKMVKTWAFLGGVLIEDGQYDKAKATLEKSKALSNDPKEKAGIERMLNELKKRQATDAKQNAASK